MVYWLRCPVGGGALAGLFIAFCVLISYTVSTRLPSGIQKKGENSVSAYLITYDLNAQGQNYESVINYKRMFCHMVFSMEVFLSD